MPARTEPEVPTLESETLRLNRRYMVEVVERFGLCPWAARARLEGRVTALVFDQRTPDDLAASLLRMREFEASSELEVALFIYPHLAIKRLDFEHFARRLRACHAERSEPEKPALAVAAFHPQAEPVLADPYRLVPFLRRTPDPTLQLVRLSSLERVRGEYHGTSFFGIHHFGAGGADSPPDVRERIARQNLETVAGVGVPALERVFSDILRDRDEVRARFGKE